jgi:predicted enzyme related to lactoylglutathione lyase
VQLVAAEGGHHQHLPRAEGGGQEGEQVAGGAVGPVQVLDEPQQRHGGGQPLDHPEQQLEQPPLPGSAGDRGPRSRLAAPTKVGHQAGQLLPGGAGDRRQLGRVQVVSEAAQRLDDRRKRQSLLAQRHTTATKHPHPPLTRGGGELLDQAGLAHPGLATDHHHQRLAVAGMGQQLVQPRQLVGAADEAARGDLVGHVGPSMPRLVLRRVGADLKTLDTAAPRCRPGVVARSVIAGRQPRSRQVSGAARAGTASQPNDQGKDRTMRIGLASIYVDDQDQAEQFYTQVLGFQVKTSAPYGPEERWLSVVAPEDPDGVQLVLHLADEPARAFQQASRQVGRPVLSLRTGDCQAEAERLQAKGVVFVKEPGPMPYGGIDAVFADSCGNLLNLHQD